MFTAIYSLGKVVGAELLVAGVLLCAALYLGMAIFFFCVGVGLLLYARHDGKKEARKAAEQAAKEQNQQ